MRSHRDCKGRHFLSNGAIFNIKNNNQVVIKHKPTSSLTRKSINVMNM